VALLWVTFASVAPVLAEDKHWVTIGFGLGAFSSGKDELRQPMDRNFVDQNGVALKDDESMDFGAGSHFLFEFYPVDYVALGFRIASTGASRKLRWSESQQVTMYGHTLRDGLYMESVKANLDLLTLTYVVNAKSGGPRFGMTVGTGQMRYTYEQTLCKTGGEPGAFESIFGLDGGSATCGSGRRIAETFRDSTATLLQTGGIFLDLGGDGFGWRLGVNAYTSPKTKFTVPQPDGQDHTFKIGPPGGEVYVSLRWDI
jgi:hypothetical protein